MLVYDDTNKEVTQVDILAASNISPGNGAGPSPVAYDANFTFASTNARAAGWTIGPDSYLPGSDINSRNSMYNGIPSGTNAFAFLEVTADMSSVDPINIGLKTVYIPCYFTLP